MMGEEFARKLLYVRWVSGDVHTAKDRWVSDCPDDVEPRSVDNPFTFRYEETLEDDWGDGDEETWYIVGALGDRYLLGIDVDVGDEHAQTVDFDIEDLDWPDPWCLRARTPSGGLHLYVLLWRDPGGLEPEFDGIDLISDLGSIGLRGAVSPWHDSEREVLNNPSPIPCNDELDEFSVGEKPLLGQTAVRTMEDYDLPDERPEDPPHCLSELLRMRASDARNQYPRSPFHCDTHCGMMLAALGYSMSEAMVLLEKWPKPDGFDAEVTREHLERLYPKVRSGSRSPPVSKLVDAGIDLGECDCDIHKNVGSPWVTFIPRAETEWQWDEPHSLRISDVHHVIESELSDALRQHVLVIYDAVPGMGKTESTFVAAAETGEPITYLVGRGHEEMYEKAEALCDKYGLSYMEIPTLGEDCPTARGEYGQELADDLNAIVYDRGASPKEAHINMDFPCTEDGKCSYQKAWGSDRFDTADVLIGHYSHANVPKVVRGRTVVIDEFDEEAFIESLGGDRLETAINHYLDKEDRLPDENKSELIIFDPEIDDLPTTIINDSHDDVTVGREAELALDDGGHALAPYAVLTLMFGDDPTGMQSLDIHTRRCIYDHDDNEFRVMTSPNLGLSNGVIALDGTPVKEMWELVLNEDLDHHVVLEDQREAYLEEARDMTVVRTNPHFNSVGVDGHNARKNAERTRDLLTAVESEHGEAPGVITHPTAVKPLKEEGVVDDPMYFGNLLGSNRLKHKHVGVVTHGCHYGDDFVRRWCAFAGEEFEREGRGTELSYGEFGDTVLEYMNLQVLQAVLRFGRDDSPTWVYVDTGTPLPEWVPVTDYGDFRLKDGRRQVLKAIADAGEEFAASDISEQVNIGKRQVQNHLNDIEEEGLVRGEKRGRTYTWRKTAEIGKVL